MKVTDLIRSPSLRSMPTNRTPLPVEVMYPFFPTVQLVFHVADIGERFRTLSPCLRSPVPETVRCLFAAAVRPPAALIGPLTLSEETTLIPAPTVRSAIVDVSKLG